MSKYLIYSPGYINVGYIVLHGADRIFSRPFLTIISSLVDYLLSLVDILMLVVTGYHCLI